MRSINTIFLFIGVSFLINVYSQQNPYEMGKIPLSDMEMKKYKLEPEAEAVILAKYRHLEFGGNSGYTMVLHNFERIKILKEEGLSYSEINLEYMSQSQMETIKSLKARITYPDGTSLVLGKKDFERYKIDKNWSEVYFKFPKATPGCIIEYEYLLGSDAMNDNEDFVFQFDIPLKEAVFSYNINQDYDYIFHIEGEQYVKNNTSFFYIENVPSLIEGPFITSMSEYAGKIKTRIKGFDDGFGSQYSMELNPQELLKDRFFGGQIKKSPITNYIIKKTISEFDQNASGLQKVNNVLKYLHKHIEWDSSYGIFSTDGIVKAFKNKSASATELNMMAMLLLNELGVESFPVLVGHRENGKIYDDSKFLTDFSYMIMIGKVDGIEMFIDASSPFLSPGQIQFSALNRKGLLLIGKEAKWIPIQAGQSSKTHLCELSVKEGELYGIIQSKYDGYKATEARKMYHQFPDGLHWLRKFRNDFPRSLIHNIEINNELNVTENLTEKIEISIPGALDYIDDTLRIDPFIIKQYKINPLSQESRGFEINFGYPGSEQNIYVLDIPDGYEINSVPDPISIINASESASFHMDVNLVESKIQIVERLVFNQDVYPKEEFLNLKSLFQKRIDKQSERILLVKTITE